MIVCTTVKAAIVVAHALTLGMSDTGAMQLAKSAGSCADRNETLVDGGWFRKNGFHISQWNAGASHYFSASQLIPDNQLRSHYLAKPLPGTNM
jgi:hypothetical protein